MLLTAEETRVLGALVEKAMATPGQYPMTEAAVLAACNQTTSREPVTDYDLDTVRRTLRSLREQGLARVVHRQGDRTDKHRHLLAEALEVDDAAVAVLAVLMLRGPQTVAELRTRTERLHAFADRDAVERVLEDLEAREPEPLVELLPRRPGQKEVRWMQLLTDPDARPETVAAPARMQEAVEEGPRREPISAAALAEQIAALRAEVAQLRTDVAALREGSSHSE